MPGPDKDLEGMSHADLLDAARKMRAAIRKHRDASEHALCWHHPDMWDLLPEKSSAKPEVPDWPQFMRGCIHYRESLDKQLPDAPRISKEFKA